MVQVDQGVKLEERKPFVEILLASLKVDPVDNLPYQLLAPCRPALLWERIRFQMLLIDKLKSTLGYVTIQTAKSCTKTKTVHLWIGNNPNIGLAHFHRLVLGEKLGSGGLHHPVTFDIRKDKNLSSEMSSAT